MIEPLGRDLSEAFLAEIEEPRAPREPLPTLDPTLGGDLFASDPPSSDSSSAPTAQQAPSPASSAQIDPTESLPRVGSTIDKYRIEELLGTGGFGVVYRARHLILNRPVALKLLRKKLLATRPGLADLLCEEARYAAKISHPNVVHVFDVTHTPQIAYVVMEYVEGRTLAQAIKREGRIEPEAALSIAADVAAGLAAALESGIIHRDIKPQNIILAHRGPAKILDLGLALSTTERPTTGRGSVVGTYGYMAPEQADDPESVDFRADIYALGVTLFHALVGAPPFPMGDPVRCLELHRTEPVPPLEEIVPSIPAPVSYFVRWMMAKDPARRPASYAVLQDSLEKIRGVIAAKTRAPHAARKAP